MTADIFLRRSVGCCDVDASFFCFCAVTICTCVALFHRVTLSLLRSCGPEVACARAHNQNEFDSNMAANECQPAGTRFGAQHGSAAGIDPPAVGRPDLAAFTTPAVAAGRSPSTRRRDSASPLLDAENQRRVHGEESPRLRPVDRSQSRPPNPVTPPRPFTRPVEHEDASPN